MNWIRENRPELLTLYEDIYELKDRGYWSQLDGEMQAFTAQEGLPYVRDDDSMKRPFAAPPVVVNYFFHEEIIPSAKKKHKTQS
jgi:Trm5-related predicted tRNA methylase